MTDEIALRQQVDRAVRARALIDQPMFAETLADLEASYIAKWRNTRSVDFESREANWHAVQAIADIRSALQRMIADGNVAETELKAAGL